MLGEQLDSILKDFSNLSDSVIPRLGHSWRLFWEELPHCRAGTVQGAVPYGGTVLGQGTAEGCGHVQAEEQRKTSRKKPKLSVPREWGLSVTWCKHGELMAAAREKRCRPGVEPEKGV